MALPLPQVVSDVGPGGPLITSMRGTNAFVNDLYNMQQNRSAAEYAPYTNYANALSKVAYSKMLPYQIQAQVLSNPYMWMAMKDNPQGLNQLLQNFSQSVPNMNNLDSIIPRPYSTGNGLLTMLINKITGQGNSSNSLVNNNENVPNQMGQSLNESSNSSPDGTSTTGFPLLPSSKGPIAGIIGQQTAKFNKSPYPPGSLISDENGNAISVPTERSITNSQTAINAAKRVEPQLTRLADAAGPFLSAGGQIKNILEGAANYIAPSKFNFESPTKYAEFKSILKSAPEALVKSYGLNPTNETIQRMEEIIEPVRGETADQYKARILRQLEQIRQEQVGVSQEQLASGYKIPKSTLTNKSNQYSNKEIDLGKNGEAVIEKTKMIGNKNYFKINGKWYEQ